MTGMTEPAEVGFHAPSRPVLAAASGRGSVLVDEVDA